MKYQCEICGKLFNSVSECNTHTEQHPIEDLYLKWFQIDDRTIFIPGGYILLADGYLMSGACIHIGADRIEVHMEHYPQEILRTKAITDISMITQHVDNSVKELLSKCVMETYADWLNRKSKEKE